MWRCSLWLAWSVPSSAKWRRAVNWASIRLSQELLVGCRRWTPNHLVLLLSSAGNLTLPTGAGFAGPASHRNSLR